MGKEYSINIDWQNEREDWINHGSSLIREKEEERLNKCKHGNKENGYCNECDCYPDDRESDNEPMMNYAYPLYGKPTDEQILKICEETNLTVMEKTYSDDREGNGDCFLALTGGGMDLSQDVGLAYIYADERIPPGLAFEICTQYGLSVSGERWFKVMRECKLVLSQEIDNAKRHIKEISEAIKEAKEQKKD